MEKRCVFISHSKQDIAKVNPLVEQLKKGNYEVIRSSHSERDDAGYIERACAFIVCLSVRYSTEDSCHNEFLMLHWQEKPMVPVILDSVSWPPGDNLFIHRDFFWSLNSLMLDLADGRSGDGLVSQLNTALGIITQQDDSWGVGVRKSAPSPAALSSAQQKARDDDIMVQLAAQSAEYQNLASAPASVSGRDRTRSGMNYIDQSAGDRGRSATSRHDRSSVWAQESRRSSLLTVTTVEGANEPNDQNSIILNTRFEDNDKKSSSINPEANPVNVKGRTKGEHSKNETITFVQDGKKDTCDSIQNNSAPNLNDIHNSSKDNREPNSGISPRDQGLDEMKINERTATTSIKPGKSSEEKSLVAGNTKKSKTCAIL